MKLIVGLGNIGKAYENTRHNVGFIAIDAILNDLKIKLDSNSFNGQISTITINNQKVIFIKPTTLMNLSGNCVAEIAHFYKINPQDIIIIHDDLDLEIGKYKINTNGSSGGHNGIKDIINKLKSDEFIRFKIGIGRPKNISVIDYVLGKFTNQELEQIHNPILKCVQFIKMIMCIPLNQAISRMNQKDK